MIVFLSAGSLSLAENPNTPTHAYSRTSGPRTGFAMDAAFLHGSVWDFRKVSGKPMVSQIGQPVTDDVVVLSRELVSGGTLHVRAGEFAAVLHRERVRLKNGDIAVQYRWLGARQTTLALVRGPSDSDTPYFQQATLVVQLEAGAPPTGIRVHQDEIALEIYQGIHYSLDMVPRADPQITEALSQLTGHTSGGALLADNSWDFSGVDTVYPAAARVAETTVPIRICNGGSNDGLACDATDALSCPSGSCDPDLGGSCNAARCGYSLPENDYVSRQENLDAGSCEGTNGDDNGEPCTIGAGDCLAGNTCHPNTITAAQEREATCFGGSNEGTACPTGTECADGGVCGETIWLRAGAQNEGSSSQALKTGEGRFCYDDQLDENSLLRGVVAQWEFRHADGARRYMELGDSWQGSSFDCTLNLFNQACGVNIGGFTPPRVKTQGNGFSTEILAEGSVKLPSGHWFDALVARQKADFGVFFETTVCEFFPVQEVLQPVILFVVPNLGTVVQINGPLDAVDDTSWSTINETRVRFGLFPALSTQVDTVGTDSVTLSWNPGNQMGFIDRAKIYWDTDSGNASAYGFNSDTHPGQVSFAAGSPPTSVTISGLTPGQSYFFTVTLLDTFTEDDGFPTVEYESLLFPKTASGTDELGTVFTYPQEVSGMPVIPGCAPTTEVANLGVANAGGMTLDYTWDAVVGDPCFDHYVLLGANDPSSSGNFSVVSQTGTSTLFNGNPAFGYFLVVAEGAGGQRGPLGHYGE